MREGLKLPADDLAKLEFLERTDAFPRSRYIQTGATSRLPDDALSQICERLDLTIGDAIVAAGNPLRRLSR